MVIEDMQQSLELLENIKNFFYNIEEIEKKLNMDLRNKELRESYKNIEFMEE